MVGKSAPLVDVPRPGPIRDQRRSDRGPSVGRGRASSKILRVRSKRRWTASKKLERTICEIAGKSAPRLRKREQGHDATIAVETSDWDAGGNEQLNWPMVAERGLRLRRVAASREEMGRRLEGDDRERPLRIRARNICQKLKNRACSPGQ
jgi:hypothetical protein